MNDTAHGRQMGLGELTDLIGPERVSGLPVGIQVVGRPGEDLRLLEVAMALEAQWR